MSTERKPNAARGQKEAPAFREATANQSDPYLGRRLPAASERRRADGGARGGTPVDASDVVVEMELVRIRTQFQWQDFFVTLVLDIGFEHVGGEHVTG